MKFMQSFKHLNLEAVLKCSRIIVMHLDCLQFCSGVKCQWGSVNAYRVHPNDDLDQSQ